MDRNRTSNTEKLTELAWVTIPREARREQARVMRLLVLAAARRIAAWTRGLRGPAPGPVDGACAADH